MDNRQNSSDAALLSAIASRDGAAFAQFYRRHIPAVLAYLMRETRDAELAADLAAEVFAAVLLAAGRYPEQGASATPWVIGIARHKLLMSLRRGRVEARARHRLGFEAVALEESDLDRVVEVAQGGSGRLLELVESLPEDERVAIRSRVLDERPYREIASELTELTSNGAHRRLRARRPGFAPGGMAAGGMAGRGMGAGGSRPPRRFSEAAALVAAAAVVGAVVAIVLVNVHSGGKPQRTSAAAGRRSIPTVTAQLGHATTAPYTVPQVVPAPLPTPSTPQSFTAVSELTWWILGPATCAGPSGRAPGGAIARTTDGGRTFTAVPAPSAPLSSPGAGKGYSELRFADAKNGFVYGPDLYVTHDGGTTWEPVDVGGRVSDLATSGGEVYAIVVTGTGNSGRLMRSPVGEDQWAPVPAAGEVSGGLWVLGHEVLVQSGSDGPGTNLLVPADGGTNFAAHPAPSPGLPCDFQTQSPPVIWARCATGTESGVWRSTDGGVSFATVKRITPGQPNSAVFAAASSSTAVYGYQQLYRTGDAGATWSPVGPSGIAQWAYLGFTDATHGVALGYVGTIAPANERLYYTTNGGQSYHLVSLP